MPSDNLLVPIFLTVATALGVGWLIVGWAGVLTFIGFLALLWLLDAVGLL